MVSEFIELRSPAGNNRVNHGIGVFWGFFGGGWAHAVRPYGFWGGWVFWGFLVGVGRTRCAPTGFGGVGFFGVFWWGLGARAPTGFGGVGFFGGFRKNTSV